MLLHSLLGLLQVWLRLVHMHLNLVWTQLEDDVYAQK